MGRRLIILVAVALAVAGGLPLAFAQQQPQQPPPTSKTESPSDPTDLPPPPSAEETVPAPTGDSAASSIPKEFENEPKPLTEDAAKDQEKAKKKVRKEDDKAQNKKPSAAGIKTAEAKTPGKATPPRTRVIGIDPFPPNSANALQEPPPVPPPGAPKGLAPAEEMMIPPADPAAKKANAPSPSAEPFAVPPPSPPVKAADMPAAGDEPVSAQQPSVPGFLPIPSTPAPAQDEQRPGEIPSNAGAAPLPAERPALDQQLERTQTTAPAAAPGGPPAAADPNGPLPPAGVKPGLPAPATGTPEPPGGVRFIAPPESIPMGKQTVGLSIDVQGPEYLNLNKESPLKIVVKNSGPSDALGVAVRDELPPNIEFVRSVPPCEQLGKILSWNLRVVQAGTEQTIQLFVRPVQVGPFDHAATVTMTSGSKARTTVREPILKVEQTVTPNGKILKGQPVEFKIRVTNVGTGPAHKVLVQAQLSPGLRHESGEANEQNLFEMTINNLEGGQHVDLDPLVADTTLGDAQSCTVTVSSPDVVPSPASAEGMKNVQTVHVIEPKLAMTISGPETRFTDTEATYEITVKNGGTAPARKVRVRTTLPISGRLMQNSPGGLYDTGSRALVWQIAQLEPNDERKLWLRVRLGGVGVFRLPAESKGDGRLFASGDVSTNVSGMADVDLDVTERLRVVDVGNVTTFQVKITNHGTKDATRLQLQAVYSDNIVPVANEITDGSRPEEQVKFHAEKRMILFPLIERLGQGMERTLSVRVKATKQGLAKCHFFLMHDDLADPKESLEAMSAFRVTENRRK